jgi:FkbM family methyltransferase
MAQVGLCSTGRLLGGARGATGFLFREPDGLFSEAVGTEQPSDSRVRSRIVARSHPFTILTGIPTRRGPRRPAGISGPAVIAEGLASGLRQIGVPFVIDPKRGDLTGVVNVFWGDHTLAWTLSRAAPKIETLVAGPFITYVPSDLDLDWRGVDHVLVPARWVHDLFLHDTPQLAGKVSIWPAGVDTDHWQSGGSKEIDFLIYHKSRDPEFLSSVEETLRQGGFSFTTLHYGSYTPMEYLRALTRSRAMLFMSLSEMQPLSLFEAWSCDVPTLVWDRHLWTHRHRPLSWPASSAPYLTAHTGMSFSTIEELPATVREFWDRRDEFAPRDWILDGHTLARAAERYHAIIASSAEMPSSMAAGARLRARMDSPKREARRSPLRSLGGRIWRHRATIYRALDRWPLRILLARTATWAARREAHHADIEFVFADGLWVYRVGDVYLPGWPHFVYRHGGDLADWPQRDRDTTDDWWLHVYRPRTGDVIVDAGAGIGGEAQVFADRVGPTGRVFCLEANPATFARLSARVRLNRLANVVPCHCALVDRARSVYVEDRDVFERNTISFDRRPRDLPEAVEGVSLDDFCDRHGVDRIDFLRLNIEGSELVALAGMQSAIRRTNAVCIACHDFDGTMTRKPVIEFLEDAGFDIIARDTDARPYVRDHVHATRRQA